MAVDSDEILLLKAVEQAIAGAKGGEKKSIQYLRGRLVSSAKFCQLDDLLKMAEFNADFIRRHIADVVLQDAK